MDLLNLIISLISGAAGGNIAGVISADKNLGPILNTIVGLIGGGAAEFLLRALGLLGTAGATAAATSTGNGFDLSNLLVTIATSGVSGGVLTGLITLIKDAMNKK